jgi:hypothetical protein
MKFKTPFIILTEIQKKIPIFRVHFQENIKIRGIYSIE